MIFINVVFPEPDGPIIAINSPGSTEKLIPFSASTVLEPMVKDLLISLVSIIIDI
jgi:hypothetical protein